MLLKIGDIVTLRDRSKKLEYFKEMADIAEKRPAQCGWIVI